MTAQLARALEHIASLGGDRDFVHVEAYEHSGTHARLKHWDLIETPHTPKRTGWWRLTEIGKKWIAGRCKLPSEVQVLKDRRVDQGSGPMISFVEALALAMSQQEIEDDAEREWLRERAALERAYLEGEE